MRRHRITFKHILGVSVIITFNLVVVALVRGEIPTKNEAMLSHVLGILEGYIGAQINYYFGDSASSKTKTEILRGQLPEGKNTNTNNIE